MHRTPLVRAARRTLLLAATILALPAAAHAACDSGYRAAQVGDNPTALYTLDNLTDLQNRGPALTPVTFGTGAALTQGVAGLATGSGTAMTVTGSGGSNGVGLKASNGDFARWTTGSLTLNTLIKFSSLPTPGTWAMLAFHGGLTSENYWLAIRNDAGSYYVDVLANGLTMTATGGASTPIASELRVPWTPALNTTYMLTARIHAGQVAVFVNGAALAGGATYTGTPAPGAAGQPFSVAAYLSGTAYALALHGTLDEVAVHLCGVAAARIQAWATAAGLTPPPPPGLDTTPPNTSITSTPIGSTTSTSASLAFTGTDDVTPPGSLTFQCRIDAGAYGACSSPKVYSGLAVGSHTFDVRATDAAGNTDPTPASETWTVTTPPPGPAATRFVATTGSDAGTCTQAAPCATLVRANQVVVPGDVVSVANGNYAGAQLATPGTSAAPIRYISQTKWGAHLTSQSNLTGPYIQVENFDVGGYAGGAFALDASFDKAIGNRVTNLTFTCGQITAAIWASDGNDSPVYSSHDQEIRDNVLRDIGTGPRDGSCGSSQGIYASVAGVKIVNNLVVRALADGVSSWHAATGLTIVNNTTVDNGAGGILVGCGDAGCTSSNNGTYVANNVSYRNCIGGIYESGVVTNPTYVNNIASANAPSRCRQDLPNNTYVQGGSGWSFADPQFVSLATDDYHLQALSPGVDSGTATQAPAADIAGTARPQGAGFDRGAYER